MLQHVHVSDGDSKATKVDSMTLWNSAQHCVLPAAKRQNCLMSQEKKFILIEMCIFRTNISNTSNVLQTSQGLEKNICFFFPWLVVPTGFNVSEASN